MSVAAMLEAAAKPALMPELSPEAELAVLARSLFRTGWDDFDTGHITYRQPDGTLLVTPWGLGWNEITVSDVLRMDEDGTQIDGRWEITPAIRLHIDFHKARPGVRVSVHQHPRYTTVWSCAGRIPPPYDQRAGLISTDDIVLYDDYGGPVDGAAASAAAISAIGDRNIALLRNHGAFVCGVTMAQTFNRCTALEWRSERAWMIEAIGGSNRVLPPQGEALLTKFMIECNGEMPMLWPWAVRRELREDPALLN